MGTTFKNEGKILAWTNGTGNAVAVDEVVALGNGQYGVALVAIANGASGSVSVLGVHELDATSADAWDLGDHLYWVVGTKKLTDVVVPGAHIGLAAAAKLATETLAMVQLNAGGEGAGTAANVAPAAAATAVNPAAMTAANPAAMTAVNPAAMTAANPAAITYAAPAGGATQDAEARASLAQSAADVAAMHAEVVKLVTDLTATRAEVVKLVTDQTASRAEVVKLVTDQTASRAEVVKLVTDHASVLAQLNAEIAALKAAGLQATA